MLDGRSNAYVEAMNGLLQQTKRHSCRAGVSRRLLAARAEISVAIRFWNRARFPPCQLVMMPPASRLLSLPVLQLRNNRLAPTRLTLIRGIEFTTLAHAGE